MINLRIAFYITCLIFWHANVFGQDSTLVKQKHTSLKGYIKDMLMFLDDPYQDGYLFANQLHNRTMFSWFPGTVFTARVEARNRIFTGTLIRDIKDFEQFLDEDPGIVDMTFAANTDEYSIICLQIDRAWAGIRKGKWDFTIGRQRINWGMNTIWNPNDIFNAYNFFDFDYEERPGSDAVRLQYTTGDFSFVEAAMSKGRDNKDVTAGMLYRFNTQGYDVQFLAGYARERPVGGIGWAGNILDAGFKGEASWLGKSEDEVFDDQFIVSSGIDFSYNPGWYFNLAYLYNSTYSPAYTTGITSLLSGADPFPYEHAGLFQAAKEISPIFNTGLVFIYSTGDDIALLPSVSYSLSTNWELLLYGQYFQSLTEDVKSLNGFLRLKWSFASR